MKRVIWCVGVCCVLSSVAMGQSRSLYDLQKKLELRETEVKQLRAELAQLKMKYAKVERQLKELKAQGGSITGNSKTATASGRPNLRDKRTFKITVHTNTLADTTILSQQIADYTTRIAQASRELTAMRMQVGQTHTIRGGVIRQGDVVEPNMAGLIDPAKTQPFDKQPGTTKPIPVSTPGF